MTIKQAEIITRAYAGFYKHGFQATCIDKLLQSSGISKRTVYKYFNSKEDLIAATIAHYQHHTFQAIEEAMWTQATTPRDKILLLFDMKKEALQRGDYFGCLAINAKMEFDNKSPVIEAACASFSQALEALMVQLCRDAACSEPETTAAQLILLLNGAIICGQMKRDPQPAILAYSLAERILPENDSNKSGYVSG